MYIGDPPRLGRQRQLNATPHSRPPSQFSLLIHDDNHDDDHDDDGHEDDGHNDDDHDDDGDDEGDVKEGTGGPGADHSVGDSVNRRHFPTSDDHHDDHKDYEDSRYFLVLWDTLQKFQAL